jgi:hypothetical protein
MEGGIYSWFCKNIVVIKLTALPIKDMKSLSKSKLFTLKNLMLENGCYAHQGK